MELRLCHRLLGLLIIAVHSTAQDDPAEIFARAEKLRLETKTHGEAIALYRQASGLWKGQEGEAKARWRLGQLLDLSGDREKALAEFQAGLERAREPKLLAGLHYGMGRVLVAMGKANVGIDSYQQALVLRRQTGERFEQALTLHNLGSAYWTLGKNDEAIRSHTEALEIRREIKDQTGVAYTLYGMASVYYSWGDLERALQQYSEALAVWRQLKQVRGEADSLNAMGLMYSLLGDKRQARLRYEEALRLWAKAQDPAGEAYTLSNLALVDGPAGRPAFEKALKVLREKGDRRGQAYVLHNLADLSGSLDLFEESLAIKRELGDRTGEAQTLEKLAEAYLKAGRAQTALESASDAVKLHQEVGNKLGEAASEAVRSRALLQLGRPEEARSSIAAVLGQVEGLRAAVVNVELRSSFFATQQRIYREAIAALMELGQVEEAFEVSERSRSRILLDRVMAANEGTTESRELAATEARLSREIHAQAQRVQRLSAEKAVGEMVAARRQLDRLFESWSQVSNQRDKLVGASAEPVLAKLKSSALDARTALVEYSMNSSQSWAWVVTRDGIRPVRLASRAALVAAVRKQRAALAAKRSDAQVDRDLFRMLISPLELSRGIERLVLVLDSPLPQMSFAALGGLLERYEVVEVPSASTLIALREHSRATGRKSLRIVADPVFDAADARLSQSEAMLSHQEQADLPRLHFSRIEAAGILRIAGEEMASQFTGLGAQKDLFQRKDFLEASILHLATHAQVDEDRPELSAVVFSRVDSSGRERNGHLRLYEIYRMRLAADLVVLSGCTTALGAELGGEGTMSLARGFLFAGAKKVLASQWEVDDRATGELMMRFYEGLLRLRLPAAAALRRAQLSLRADPRWKEPYYWAGFRLAGDWN